ncbi:glutathione S-transferase A-like isoform X1 [Mytilus trossulus]|uniref:glutathione S-transferase A-like isoform X1 n=1 Tax=Mytilus trossulus TaxID=6551 RepID=UPI00300583E3
MSGKLLFWGSGSIPCWKPMLVLAEKGIDYESKQISFSEKGHKGPEVMALNPRGQVPTFKDGETVICESNAICFWLESMYSKQGTELIPSDPKEKAKVLQKAFESAENMQTKAMQGVLYYYWRTKEEDRKEETIKENLDNCRNELTVWDKYLGECGHDFVAGKQFTLADVFFFPFLAWAWRMSLDFNKFPNLKKYFESVRERPSVKATWPPHWNEGEAQPEKMAYLKTL